MRSYSVSCSVQKKDQQRKHKHKKTNSSQQQKFSNICVHLDFFLVWDEFSEKWGEKKREKADKFPIRIIVCILNKMRYVKPTTSLQTEQNSNSSNRATRVYNTVCWDYNLYTALASDVYNQPLNLTVSTHSSLLPYSIPHTFAIMLETILCKCMTQSRQTFRIIPHNCRPGKPAQFAQSSHVMLPKNHTVMPCAIIC